MNEYILGTIMGLMTGIMFFLLTLYTSMNLGYQKGQIDYANGKVLIHQVENEDSELVWEWIDNPKYK